MVRAKALRPRKRVGCVLEEPLPGPRLAQFAAPLSTSANGPLLSANVAGPSTAPPGSHNTFSGGGADGGALPAGVSLDASASSSARPTPSLPFASVALPRVGDASTTTSSSSSHGGKARSGRLPGGDAAAGADWRGDGGVDYGGSARGSDAAEEMLSISRLELERWQQKVIFQVEDHFSNEQLKRIAEFGRVHANLLVEAKQYVYDVERQLNAQLAKEHASLRAQAEAFVSKVSDENAMLRARILALERENAALRGHAVEVEDEDMTPPSVPVGDASDQENVPNSVHANSSPDDGAERDASGPSTKRGSDNPVAKPLLPAGARKEAPRPAMVTPTSVSQSPEHDGALAR